MFEVSDEVVQNVAKRYDRDAKNFEKDVEIIKQWVKTQPHLPEMLDTRSIQNFLILSKFSMEKTKQKIDNYYTFRTKFDIYREINPKLPHMKEYRKIRYVVPHPQLINNSRVCFMKVKNKNLMEKIEFIDTIRHILNAQEIRLREDVTDGEIFIVDCEDVPASYILKITPSNITKILRIYKELYSLRLKGVYFLNFPTLGEKVLNVVKMMVKPKLLERIHILKNYDVLLQSFGEEFLPPEFGGKGFSLETLQNMVEKEIENHQDLFDHLDAIKVNEKLRPSEMKDDDILGFHGNFRRIEID